MLAQKREERIYGDISADNRAALKQRFPGIYEILSDPESFCGDFSAETVPAKSGGHTLQIEKNGRAFFMHSRYNPAREAEAVIDGYLNIEKYKYVVFYGCGLGHHIHAFARRYPGKKFFIHEPFAGVLEKYLESAQIKDLPAKSLQEISCGTGKETVKGLLGRVLKKAKDQTLVIELPSHTEIFPEAWQEFCNFFRQQVKGRKSSLRSNYAYQKLWVINSIRSFPEVLNSPDILLEHGGRFSGKPAILAAAGPSLDEEIENLRHIKENRLAYIFAVGTAINTLVENGIRPHAACAYDPKKDHNQKVFRKVVERGIDDVPLVFGSSLGSKILDFYPGKKIHMLTSQDTAGNYFLQPANGAILQKVQDAPSIAVITLQMLCMLGFSRVIFAGQNLGFKGKTRYAAGVDYRREATEQEEKNALWVKDVDGNQILTNEGYDRMRAQLETWIKKFEEVGFINTTKGGADIEGAPFEPMEEVIEKYLHETVADENWHEMPASCYDAGFMTERLSSMNRAGQEAEVLLEKMDKHIKTIEKLCRNRNFAQAEKTYARLGQVFNRIKTNDFFRTFILPMNRVFYQMLASEIDDIKNEKTPLKKGELVINSFGKFFFECRKDMRIISKAYPRIQKAVKDYTAASEN